VAAVIVEPVIGTGGVIVPPSGYLQAVRKICTEYGVLMIADEVITGFGRTGRWFGVNHDEVVPDLMTFAKGLTSGYAALGAVTVSEEIWEALHDIPGDRPLMHGFTYSGHPVACAVALENLKILEEERLVEQVAEKATALRPVLESAASSAYVGEVRQRGLMIGFELVAERTTKERFPRTMGVGSAVVAAARERGVLARALLDDIVLLAPPFVATTTELTDAVQAVSESIDSVAASALARL
jgi:adenosylmethionine-8-amino-7-oxononanoate aminotransferase